MPDSLITVDEAEEIVQVKTGPASALRTPLLIALVVAIVGVLTVLIMLVISLSGSRTGLEALLPFLETKSVERLQVP
jgi:hypothetical protein